MKWRILNIDGYEDRLLELEARSVIRTFYGPAIPLALYRMLKRKQFKQIIQGLTLSRE